MSPMSLLTLPASTLREAEDHASRASQASPSGERGERRVAALALAVITTAVALVWLAL